MTIPKRVWECHPVDPDIRGYTLIALKLIDAKSVAQKAELLKADTAKVSIYDFDTGTIKKVSVAALAEELLDVLK